MDLSSAIVLNLDLNRAMALNVVLNKAMALNLVSTAQNMALKDTEPDLNGTQPGLQNHWTWNWTQRH